LTVTTIIKTIIGSGILALPFAISRLGYVFALVILLLIYNSTASSHRKQEVSRCGNIPASFV
jgi:amino acid permease